MVAHVIERVREAGCFVEALVATDDERIAEAARSAGARAVMTGECRSGTDRVAQATRDITADVVLNVQGDEPALPPENLRLLAAFLLDHPNAPMATLALPGLDSDLGNPNIVKLTRAADGRALYFSRAAIPFQRNPDPGIILKHVGLYGFQRETLHRFAALPETALERVEGLEQLRALYYGIALTVLDAVAETVAVDVPDDVPRAEAALRALAVPIGDSQPEKPVSKGGL
jgi:3-deoxy-manno-octulosonate cytidylyltransferase (CMP-KDO synthetase)